ncbi:MAG TPA: ATP-dependent DNA helicase [Dermatophilaceae bacterium]|nr:ATP-dependent DNA helicase [Dermatophilaceae bacterium]
MADFDALLRAAVTDLGGSERPGQHRMVAAVSLAAHAGRHLLVQAGTGTGKSLGYLVPALVHAVDNGTPVVVATATLALQGQIVERDLPQVASCLAGPLGRELTYAVWKGRRNYLCRNKLLGGYPSDEDTLLPAAAVAHPSSRLAAQVMRLREWAEHTQTGDRDDLVPGVSEPAWRQVSVSARECLGPRCPMAAECFVEMARNSARQSDVVVTNHAFLAVDAVEGRHLLPAHDLLIVDEAHELADRVTAAITDELGAAAVATVVRKVGRLAATDDLTAAVEQLDRVLSGLPHGRLDPLPEPLAVGLGVLRDAARAVLSGLNSASPAAGAAGKPVARSGADAGGNAEGGRAVARAAVEEVFDVAARLLQQRPLDVVWIGGDAASGSRVRVAPLSVSDLLRERLFADRTVVLTSATLELGGSFTAIAATLGLTGQDAPDWDGLDVGSPFDYRRQAIAYVAAQLPPPGRDGPSDQALDEIEALIRAAGGRTLGLFSSARAAVTAAQEMRRRLGGDLEILCQGEDQTATLVRRFARTPSTCLFGTLSLWQGVDVPGPSCQLVLIDRIPFPRPDDPLASARARAVTRSGGNGFMAVSATHAALRLAQGSGRLIRRGTDRGVVAILDPRMVTARYAGFLQASLPPFWPTTDRTVVLEALTRLATTAVDGGAAADDGGAAADRIGGVVSTGAPTPRAARSAVVRGSTWSTSQDEALTRAWSSGNDLTAIATRLDMDSDSVSVRARLLGLGAANPVDGDS